MAKYRPKRFDPVHRNVLQIENIPGRMCTARMEQLVNSFCATATIRYGIFSCSTSKYPSDETGPKRSTKLRGNIWDILTTTMLESLRFSGRTR